MEEYVGKTLGRYHITSQLGEGGMGAVFLAEDTVLTRKVAVKIMNPQMAVQPNFLERFLQEARTTARLKNPNIVQVYDFAQDGDILYIVMEYIPGKNLGQYLEGLRAKGEWLDFPETIEIGRQLALALDSAHRQGILHRDIKPANILLAPVEGEAIKYRPVLTDFGLAKLAEGGMVTQVGVSMGTPGYMSPEQALGKTTDPRSDIYSLGVLLFQLATRQLPFPAKTITDAILYHAKQAPPSPRSIRPDVPEGLESIILKAMEKDPARRFTDAAAMAKALDELKVRLTRPAPAAGADEGGVTQVESGTPDERGFSILQEFNTPAQLTRDRIQVLSQGKTTFSIPLKTGQMIIGRSRENDISLDDAKISRRHARIEYDGKDVRVVDLDSKNGTFMGDGKLLPGVPEPWPADKVLHVGDFYLHLERATALPAAIASVPLPAQDQTSYGERVPNQPDLGGAAMGGRIAISVVQSDLTVSPGQSVQLTVLVMNQGPLVEHITTTLQGIPPSWVLNPVPVIQLMPGDQREMIITIQPERISKSRAADYPMKVHIAAQEPGGDVEIQVILDVQPYSQSAFELAPLKIRAGKLARVKIQNQGNSIETYTLVWQDRAVELEFKPPSAQIQVPEGKAAYAEFYAVPRQRRLIGGDQTHPITVQVTNSAGVTQTQNGEVVSRGLIPIWLPSVAILLCLLLFAAAALFVPPLIKRPQQTRVALMATQTAAAATQYAIIVLSVTPTPTPTATPTATRTATPTGTPTPTPVPYIACPGLYQSRIHVSDFAFVSKDPPIANRVREKPNTDAKILGFIEPGEKIEILEGPFCGDWIWWRMRSMQTGISGWTAEGDNKTYWLVPMSR
jgi:eukaryotic-like serine/threonine-protein kinase